MVVRLCVCVYAGGYVCEGMSGCTNVCACVKFTVCIVARILHKVFMYVCLDRCLCVCMYSMCLTMN